MRRTFLELLDRHQTESERALCDVIKGGLNFMGLNEGQG